MSPHSLRDDGHTLGQVLSIILIFTCGWWRWWRPWRATMILVEGRRLILPSKRAAFLAERYDILFMYVYEVLFMIMPLSLCPASLTLWIDHTSSLRVWIVTVCHMAVELRLSRETFWRMVTRAVIFFRLLFLCSCAFLFLLYHDIDAVSIEVSSLTFGTAIAAARRDGSGRCSIPTAKRRPSTRVCHREADKERRYIESRRGQRTIGASIEVKDLKVKGPLALILIESHLSLRGQAANIAAYFEKM